MSLIPIRQRERNGKDDDDEEEVVEREGGMSYGDLLASAGDAAGVPCPPYRVFASSPPLSLAVVRTCSTAYAPRRPLRVSLCLCGVGSRRVMRECARVSLFG